MHKHYLTPPSDHSFDELFRFFWQHGVGRIIVGSTLPDQWTASELVDAMDTIGVDISERSIDNWLSGAFVPSPVNLRCIAQIAADDRKGRTEWLEALVAARARSKQTSPHVDQQASGHQDTQDIGVPSLKLTARVWLLGIAVVIAISVALVTTQFGEDKSPERRIADLKVCDRSRFDESAKRCLEHVSTLPKSTERVYASFVLEGFAEGARFERIWFRCGQRIHSRQSRNVPPWEGWTWFQTEKFKRGGKFAVNVLAETEVASAEFQIGDHSQTECGDF